MYIPQQIRKQNRAEACVTLNIAIFSLRKYNQTVHDGVAHSKNPRKCAYHVTFDLDLRGVARNLFLGV